MAKKNKKDKEAKKARAELKNKKNQQKAAAKDKKLSSKRQDDDPDNDDVDIDTILEEFKQKQENFEKIDIQSIDKPVPRTNACFITNPAHSKHELLLFGGEITHRETNMTTFYNDLLTFNADNNTWKRYTSKNSPMPRSSAAMAAHPSGIALVHGGEFSSPKQSTFYHYNDTWILDIASREWNKIENSKNSPSARSGHRISVWKNYFILFGGFRDLGSSTTYLNDLWVFDTINYKWKQIEFPKNHIIPDARSGHSWIPINDGIMLYGGYTKIKARKGLQVGKILSDCWMLKMNSNLDQIRWERRKKQGFQPSPRVGAPMTIHKGRGIMFGGVYDFEETEESLDSMFYNDLFSYNVDSNRWFALNLRKFNANTNNKLKSNSNKVSKDQERELQNLLNKILEKNNINDEDSTPSSNQQSDNDEINDNYDENDDTDSSEDDNENNIINITRSSQLPHVRFNAATTVLGDNLYIYGGSWEYGEKDYVIDSFYSVDLNKIDGVSVYWEDLKDIELAKKLGEQDSDDEDDDDDGDYEDDDDYEEEIKDEKLVAEDEEEEEEIEEEEMEIPDLRPWLPHPKAFESLREFYIREGPAFLEWAISNNKHARGKYLKQKSFELCQDRWWERRDQIRIEEDKLEELGVSGDVVERDTSKPISKRR